MNNDFELVKNSSDIVEEINKSKLIHIIKGITPSNIKNYSNKQLISLTQTEKNFFSYIDINALKLFDNEVIKSISNKIISKLTLEQIEKLTGATKIKYLNKKFLQNIEENILSQLSNNFFNQISIEQFENVEEETVIKLVKMKKIGDLNTSVLKIFYKKYFNYLKDITDIEYSLSKSGKHLEYLTNDNFIYLSKFIGKDGQLENYFKKLKKFPFRFDEDEFDINTNNREGILNDKEFVDFKQIEIRQNEIKERIQNFLSDGEGFGLLKDYCIQCLEDEENKQIVIKTLLEILNEPMYTIFKKIDHYKILEILIILDNNEENHINYYIKLRKLIKEINDLVLFDPCEFYQKINFFSEIINDGCFNIDFLEILAEENLKNIKYLINTFFTGTDKTAIPESLRYQHVKIIKDYMDVIKTKHNIDENKIINELTKITQEKDNDNLELRLNLYVKSLNIPEKLYYDLLIQSYIEMPSFEKNVEEKFNKIFKFLRDIGLTFLGAKCASLTGSKVLTSISVGVGVAKILKNIKDEVIKSFFSLSDSQKRLFLINYRNTPQTTFGIISKKIKECYRKVIIPAKKGVNSFIRQKILRLRNETKIGFDKINFSFKNTIDLKKECDKFGDNVIKLYIKRKKLMIEPLYIQKLHNILEKLGNQFSEKYSKKFKEFLGVKEKLIKYHVNKKKRELQEKYPEFDDSFSNKIKQNLNKTAEFFVGLYNGFISSITFNSVDLRIKDNKSKFLQKLLFGVKETKYLYEVDNLKKFEKNCNINIINDKITYLVYSTKDKDIFKRLKAEEKKFMRYLKSLEKYLRNNEGDNTNIINLNATIEEMDNINSNTSISSSEYFDDKNEPLIK